MRIETFEYATLYCASCEDVLPTLTDGSVDFCFTDPPYGHNNNDGDLISNIERAVLARRAKGDDGTRIYETRPILNDGAEANDLVQFLFNELSRLLPPGACCCCCCGGGGGPDPQFARWSLWLDKAVGFKQMIVWDKGPMGMGWHYRRSYETVLVGEKPGAACRWYDNSLAIENIIRPGAFGVRKIIPGRKDHPTTKPEALAAHFIDLHSLPDHLVLDPFMGAGSTGVSAVRAGRRFIGVELDPRWFDDACRRIEKAHAEVSLMTPVEFNRSIGLLDDVEAECP